MASQVARMTCQQASDPKTDCHTHTPPESRMPVLKSLIPTSGLAYLYLPSMVAVMACGGGKEGGYNEVR